MQNIKINKRVYLSSRPGVNGQPTVSNFCCESISSPPNPRQGEVLLETLYLSVDPYMRCRMNEDSGVDYAPAWKLGDTISGSGVGIVIKSCAAGINEGDLVSSAGLEWPWQTLNNLNAESVQKLHGLIPENASLALGIFGVTGLTAALGISEMCNIVADANQVMVISAAAGACGTTAGQLAKLQGCKKVIGITGSEKKCEFLCKKLQFDAAICYKTQDVAVKLKEICPQGIDIYFDNVGGEISDAVIRQMNPNSQVILCGQISVYNKDVPYPPPIKNEIQSIIESRKISRDRFLVLNYPNKFEKTLTYLREIYEAGKIVSPENFVHGLENGGQAFIDMMNGCNTGKQIVKL